MRKVLPVMTVVFALLGPPGSDAGEISVYTDQNGVINLTDRPVPAGARVRHVIRYKEKSAADLEQQQALYQHTQQAVAKQKEARKYRELNEEAARARAEAEEKSTLAREKIKTAEAYLERHRQKRRTQQRRHRKTAQRVAREAAKAQALANAAITRANQAQEAVLKASVGLADNASDRQTGNSSTDKPGKAK